jgi:RimJ/RimL family protein N-acetyltransferase
MDELRTERLVGSRPLLRDADELHPICADPRVARWVFVEEMTLARTRSMLVFDTDHWKRHRFGRWVLRDSATRAVVGMAGLLVEPGPTPEAVEIAWFLDADRWGEGLATEFMRPVMRFAFDDLGLPELTAKTLADNERSRALMERLGLAYERDIVHAGMPHVLYRVTNAPS